MGTNWKAVAKLVAWLTLAGLGLALLLFERVNYITTYESLRAVFGVGMWITILAWGVVLIDFFALARAFVPDVEGQKEPQIVQVLLGLWLIVALLDMTFNWFFAAIKMESTQVQAPQAIGEFIWVMPIITALVIWGVQFGLLYLFGLFLRSAVQKQGLFTDLPRVPAQKPVSRPVSQQRKTQPVPTNGRSAIQNQPTYASVDVLSGRSVPSNQGLSTLDKR